jgi:hypothetical protein
VTFYEHDVADEAQWTTVVDNAEADFGGLDTHAPRNVVRRRTSWTAGGLVTPP